jgi:predicted flap endonuclease-1-like 5' DNA nuclease
MRGTGYAIAEIVWWMFAAGVVGVAIGWVTRGLRSGDSVAAPESDAFVAGLRTQVDELNAKLGIARLGHEDCIATLEARERKIVELEARSVTSLAQESSARSAVTTAPDSVATASDELPDRATAIAQVAEIAVRTRGTHARVDDDLKQIHGVGPKLERLLKSMDITSFRQVARFETRDVAYVTAALDAFPGRIERDDWMSSAGDQHTAKYGDSA